MNTGHDAAPGGEPGAATMDQQGSGSGLIIRPAATQPAARFNVPEQLARRRQAARRLVPLPDGTADPYDLEAAEPGQVCSRGFACQAQTLETLSRAHHCPCVEAAAAVAGVVA